MDALLPDLPTAFYLLAAPAVLLTGVSKGGLGGALGALAVPMMSLAIAPTDAAAIMLPILCLADLAGLKAYWGAWDRALLRALLPGALFGVAVGALSFGRLSQAAVQALVGLIAVLFALYSGARLLKSGAPRAPAAGAPPRGGAALAALSGYTSFVAHAGGPPVMMYLLPQRLPARVYAATLNAFLLALNAAKLLPYGWNGQFNAANLAASAALAPLIPLGVGLGAWLTGRVNERIFYAVAQAGLLATGVALLASAGSAP